MDIAYTNDKQILQHSWPYMYHINDTSIAFVRSNRTYYYIDKNDLQYVDNISEIKHIFLKSWNSYYFKYAISDMLLHVNPPFFIELCRIINNNICLIHGVYIYNDILHDEFNYFSQSKQEELMQYYHKYIKNDISANVLLLKIS